MRFAVTRSTRRDGFVFILMAISTSKVMVFCRILFEQGAGFLMTRRAIMRRGSLVDVSYDKWHMNRVAGKTGFKLHILRVLFVTLHALRDLSVCCMAFVTSQIRMGTGMFLYFFTLLLVTCKTRSGDLAFYLQSKGGVGVGMTA
jgi:hypothetical protein